MPVNGLHHVTAITGNASRNVDFYVRVMGMRLAKKTVNQDDTGVYHLFYGDEQGSPGFDLTFFEYPNAIPGRHGDGMVHTVVFRVASEAALDFWEARLGGDGVATERTPGQLAFADPEGLGLELRIEDVPDEPLTPDAPDVPQDVALQGFAGVRAYGSEPQRSAPMLERVLGFTDEGDGRFLARDETRGGWIAYEPPPAERGRQSAGTVHHIAWSIGLGEQDAWQQRVTEAGLHATPVIDRFYFRSIYFREPSGILFELATRGPGFTVDEPLETLGEGLALPPFLEPQRASIEARLTPLPTPRGGHRPD